MPKVAILNNFAKTEAAKGFTNYDGPTPPKGVYRTKVKQWKIVENSSGDQMFKLLLEIAEPKKSKKAQYNGFAIWENLNLTDKGAPYVNAALDGFGIPRKAVWGGSVITSKDDDEKIVKIGGKSVEGLEIVVSTRRRKYDDEYQLSVTQWLGQPEDSDDEDSDDDDEDEDLADSDDDSDDDDDDDEEDEDEKPAAKRAKAKAAAAKAKSKKRARDDEDDEDDDDSF